MISTRAIAAIIGVFLAGIPAWGDESGFLLQGKAHVVYRDGEKVGKTPEELGIRKPASFSQGQGILFYQKHGDVTCYYTANDSSLYCMK
jgi:hypothetical protein